MSAESGDAPLHLCDARGVQINGGRGCAGCARPVRAARPVEAQRGRSKGGVHAVVARIRMRARQRCSSAVRSRRLLASQRCSLHGAGVRLRLALAGRLVVRRRVRRGTGSARARRGRRGRGGFEDARAWRPAVNLHHARAGRLRVRARLRLAWRVGLHGPDAASGRQRRPASRGGHLVSALNG